MTDPMLDISHLTGKDKIVSYAEKLIVKDHINKIDAELEFNPKVEQQASSGYLSSLKSKLWKSKKRQGDRSDYIKVTIYKAS